VLLPEGSINVLSTVNPANIERALITISEFIGSEENVIPSGLEFNNLLDNTFALLIIIGEERNTNFYKLQINKAPQFTDLEIDKIIVHRRGDHKLYTAIGGIYGILFNFIKDKTSNNTVSLIKVASKLDDLQLVIQRFLQTIKKPGMEAFYMESLSL